MTATPILTAAQALPPKERENLCAKIAASLEAPLTVEKQAWAGGVKKRAEERRSGKVEGRSAEAVFAKARPRFGK